MKEREREGREEEGKREREERNGVRDEGEGKGGKREREEKNWEGGKGRGESRRKSGTSVCMYVCSFKLVWLVFLPSGHNEGQVDEHWV